MDIETMLNELHYPVEVERMVRRELGRDETRQLAPKAYDGENFEFPLCRQNPLTRLAVVTYLLGETYCAYREKGVQDSIIFDTFRDVSLRARLFWEKTGAAGLSEEDVIWFRHIINVGIFKIGALQYQPFEMLYLDEEGIGEPYMNFSQKPLAAGESVVNIHIQRGADLHPEAVAASLTSARSFFGEGQSFLCYSWLLYPPMVERLPKTSNIRQFAERFTIVGTCGDSEQARENLDRDSSLYGMINEDPNWFGFACGMIL